MITELDLEMALKDPKKLSRSEMDAVLESQLTVLQELHKVYPKQPKSVEKNIKESSSAERPVKPKSVRRGLRNLRKFG